VPGSARVYQLVGEFVMVLSSVESLFIQDLDGVFDKMIDTVYKETSRHLLHVLHIKYKFMDHLKVNIASLPSFIYNVCTIVALGLALCLPSISVSLVFMVLCIFKFIC